MFKNKVVLITGGSSGIGKATVLLFIEKRADVAFTFKENKQGADSIVDEIIKKGGKVIAIQADLNNEKEAKSTVEKVINTFGKIDILVNNAGRYVEGDEWNGSSDIWTKTLQQNLVSMMCVSKYVIPIFQKQNGGVVVNVASRHGVNGHSDAISYSAAKAGVINITQSYAQLLAPFGRVNSVSPSATNAGYWLKAPKEELAEILADRPDHKLIKPETVAEKIVYLASDEAKNINSQNIILS